MPESLYTDELADTVLERIAGGESIRSITADPDMPSMSTLLRWSVGESGAAVSFPDRYRRAMQLRGEGAADKIFETIEKVEAGEIAPDAARAIMDGAKWIAAKLYPKTYGDRQEHLHKLTHSVSVRDRLARAEERISDHRAEYPMVIDGEAEVISVPRESGSSAGQ